MNKRPYPESAGAVQPHHQHKKHKHDNHQKPRHRDGHKERSRRGSSQLAYEESLSKLPQPTTKLGAVSAYTHFTVAAGLPPLPEVHDELLRSAPFKHKSTINYDRSAMAQDVTYEKLEFLGDAQLEHIASRLIYERFFHLPAGQQSQLRELLVKNETLAEYAKAYGFDKRVEVGDMHRMQEDTKDRGNKGFNKILGDVFEAYIAAVILSDDEHGFAVAEKWMTALWAPKLVEAAARDKFYNPNMTLQTDGSADPLTVYSPTAKADIQKRILAGAQTKLAYEPYQDSIELKGDQLGQNKHFIALYLTGYGYERKLLGKGEGKNKVEAGNWAATEAMHGENKAIVEECEKQLSEIREKKKAEREAAEKV